MKQATDISTPFYNFLILPRYRILRHACLFTALFFVSFNYAMPYVEYHILSSSAVFVYLSVILVTFLIVAYFTFYYLIPRYLLQNKYLSFIGWLSVCICVLLVIQNIAEIIFCRVLDIPIVSMYNWHSKLILTADIITNFFINFIAFTGGSVTILLKHWHINHQKAAQLEEEHLRNDVEHLKEQINPGFMFQTLHYAGRLEDTDPTRASDILMKLSRLLRYQLYDCNHSMVFLLSEIRYIENYLLVEKTYNPGLSYNIHTEGEIHITLVPPLLFIPFIQFMTGKSGNAQKTIDIAFCCSNEIVSLLCRLCPEEEIQSVTNDRIPELEKITQRLEILFRNDYKLDIYQGYSGNIHSIHLQFNADTL